MLVDTHRRDHSFSGSSQLDSSYRSISKHTGIESWESASITHTVVSSSITHNTIDGTTALVHVTCGFIYCVYTL